MTSSPIRRATRATIALALLAGLAACSASGKASSSAPTTAPTTAATSAPATAGPTSAPASPPAQAPDPCSLVTKAQAEKVVGVTLNDPTKAGSGDDVLCQFTSDPNGPTAQVEVFVGDGAKKQLDIDKDTLQHDFTQLDGIGDEAWLEQDDVFVRKGTVWTSVNIVALDAPPDQVQANLQDLAKIIAGEL